MVVPLGVLSFADAAIVASSLASSRWFWWQRQISQVAMELAKENDGVETTSMSIRLEMCDGRSRSASPNGQREN